MLQEHSSVLEQFFVEHITQIIMTADNNTPESGKKSLTQGLFSFLSPNQNEEEEKQPQICEDEKSKFIRDKFVQRTIELGLMDNNGQWTMVQNIYGNWNKKASRLQRALWIKKYCEIRHKKHPWIWAEQKFHEKNIKQAITGLKYYEYKDIPECQDILLVFNDIKWRNYKDEYL